MKQKEVKEYKETHLPLISKKVDDYVWAMCAVYTAPAVGYWEEKKRKLGKSLWDCLTDGSNVCQFNKREKDTVECAILLSVVAFFGGVDLDWIFRV